MAPNPTNSTPSPAGSDQIVSEIAAALADPERRKVLDEFVARAERFGRDIADKLAIDQRKLEMTISC